MHFPATYQQIHSRGEVLNPDLVLSGIELSREKRLALHILDSNTCTLIDPHFEHTIRNRITQYCNSVRRNIQSHGLNVAEPDLTVDVALIKTIVIYSLRRRCMHKTVSVYRSCITSHIHYTSLRPIGSISAVLHHKIF